MAQKPITVALLILGLVVGVAVGVHFLFSQTARTPLHVAVDSEPESEIAGRGGTSHEVAQGPETGSLFRPEYVAQDRAGYVLAEIYQDLANEPAPVWVHAGGGKCELSQIVASQPVRPLVPPTLTPTPTPPLVEIAIYEYDTVETEDTPAPTPHLTRTVKSLVTPTPEPKEGDKDTDPTPTPRPAPVWSGWKGRPVSVQMDGLAVLESPADAKVSAQIRVFTGRSSHVDEAVELARLPMPWPHWSADAHYLHFGEASGRVNLVSDHIDVAHAFAMLYIEVEDVDDCGALSLHWQRPVGVVVKALTDNPFEQWGGPVGEHGHALIAGAIRSTEVSGDASAVTEYVKTWLGNTAHLRSTSTTTGHITLPPRCETPPVDGGKQDDIDKAAGCIRADDPADTFYLVFAVRSDLAPADGLTDMRETGSVFDARGAFVQTTGKIPADGYEYQIYRTAQSWVRESLGVDWSLQ